MTVVLIAIGAFLALAVLDAIMGKGPKQGAEAKEGALDRVNAYVTEAADAVGRSAVTARERHEALSALELSLHAERALFRTCLKTARSVVDLNERFRADPRLKAEFDRIQGNYDGASDRIAEKLAAAGIPRRERIVFAEPDFSLPTSHMREEVADHVRARILSLKGERAAYLADIVNELRGKPELEREFQVAMRRFEAGDHLAKVRRELAT